MHKETETLRVVHNPHPKTDAAAIAGGAPVYTGDLVPPGALVVKLLRSPHAFAEVLEVDAGEALALPGVACVLSHKDLPETRFSTAGETFPGNNPLDRRILDRWVRYVGDPVAIVAAEDEKTAELALEKIKVRYGVLTPVLDFTQAEGNASVVHPEEDYRYPMDVGGDPGQNLLGREEYIQGDFDGVFAACPVQVDETFSTVQNQQAMLETYRSFTRLDHLGRLEITSSTQIPFHTRRIAAQALGLPQSRVTVAKPRVGGGFGAKQTVVSELFPAAVTLRTGRSAYCCFTRQESFVGGNTRHRFRIRVRLGADETGVIRAAAMDCLEDAGAYGEHSINVIGLSGRKNLPRCARAEAVRFTGRVVYTNTTPGGAYRGFGATQGCFALESAMDILAEKLGMCPAELRLRNLPRVGETMPIYYGETLTSSALERCVRQGMERLGWQEKWPRRAVGPHKVRGVGMALTMQGSGLTGLDSNSAVLRLEDGGFYTLHIGATDIGTGCDTILAQMAAEVLGCAVEDVVVPPVRTDTSPYDTGSYASCTTYVTGNAVILAAEKLLEEMRAAAGEYLNCPAAEVDFDGETFSGGGRQVSRKELAWETVNGPRRWLSASASFSGKQSPPPFVAGFAEVEVDTETGAVAVTDFVAEVDCGTVINPTLARVQTEGGIVQGLGMALMEDVSIAPDGRLRTDGFLSYKIPSRLDVPPIRVEFAESYEPSGPFGAKSLGEVVLNTAAPAVANAVYNAVGLRAHSLPIRPEWICLSLREMQAER